jgi:hypothetical protein
MGGMSSSSIGSGEIGSANRLPGEEDRPGGLSYVGSGEIGDTNRVLGEEDRPGGLSYVGCGDWRRESRAGGGRQTGRSVVHRRRESPAGVAVLLGGRESPKRIVSGQYLDRDRSGRCPRRAGPQFLYSLEPIFLRRPIRTAASLPEFMRQGGDFPMPESGDAVPHCCFMTLALVLLPVLKR